MSQMTRMTPSRAQLCRSVVILARYAGNTDHDSAAPVRLAKYMAKNPDPSLSS